MVIDNPLYDPKGILNYVLSISDIVFTGIFTLEVFMKIIADGLILNGEKSYLRNGWNNLDFAIVAISVSSTI